MHAPTVVLIDMLVRCGPWIGENDTCSAGARVRGGRPSDDPHDDAPCTTCSRFRIVKIDSYVDRGRWHCHNFADPDLDPDQRRAGGVSGGVGGVGGGVGGGAAARPVYYIDPRAGACPPAASKFYVSTIVYGVHGHPVLDRTVRISAPRRRDPAGDVARSRDAGDVTGSRRVDRSGDDALPLDDVITGRASTDDDVAKNPDNDNDDDDDDDDGAGNRFSGGGVPAAATMTSSSMTSAAIDVIGRCPPPASRSVSLRQQDDVTEARCRGNGFGRLLSVDERRLATRFAASTFDD